MALTYATGEASFDRRAAAPDCGSVRGSTATPGPTAIPTSARSRPSGVSRCDSLVGYRRDSFAALLGAPTSTSPSGRKLKWEIPQEEAASDTLSPRVLTARIKDGTAKAVTFAEPYGTGLGD